MPRRNPCGKVVYKTRRAVLKAMEKLPYNDDHREMRAYRCNQCKGWHMTSKV